MLTGLRQHPLALLSGLLALGVLWIAWPRSEARSPHATSPAAEEPNRPIPQQDEQVDEEEPTSAAPRLEIASATPDPEPLLTRDAGKPARPGSERAFWDELMRLRASNRLQALHYAELGEQWYGDTGRPAEARRAMLVSLLIDLDRMEEARARTREFIQKYPDSSYLTLVQGLTGIHPRPGAPTTRPADGG